MTESKLLERKIESRLGELETTAFAVQAPIQGWKMGAGKTYLRGGIPRPGPAWRALACGEAWSPQDEATWFVARAVVPQGWRGGPLIARVDLAAEGQAFVNGTPHQSLDRFHQEIVLGEEARPGERFDLAVEVTRTWYNVPIRPQVFTLAELAIPVREVRDLLHWLRLGLETARALPEESTDRLRVVRALDEAIGAVDLQQVGSDGYLRSVRRAGSLLRGRLGTLSERAGPGKIALIGHAHIDTAWLWPLAETKRKCGRTFSGMLRLMEQYPEFRFSQSQPQLYQFTKELFPDLYAQIKSRVAEGRWETVGGAWVECDCNMPSGEALIRQFLYGKRFFREEFGRDTDVGWWPDAFGYTWSLPQILRHCGVNYFFTTKISWNQYNEFPYGLFWWQGIDGTRILSAMGQFSYNGQVRPGELREVWQRFAERDRVDEYLLTFGFGDGGGGPTTDMIERGRRLQSMVGVPQCRFTRVDDFWPGAAQQSEGLPVWNGELYLEMHRGCQTTQARAKRHNRKLELLLRDVEQLAAVASARLGADYPADVLTGLWHRVLCYQFHDILPGSSIRQVYEELERDYAEIASAAEALRDSLLETIGRSTDTRGDGKAVVVFNTLSWERTEVVEVTVGLEGDAFVSCGPSGVHHPCQVLAREGGLVKLLMLADQVPPFGHAVFHLSPETTSKTAEPVRAAGNRLENAELRARFDRAGRLTGVLDKAARREVLAPAARGNLLQFFDDRPMDFDAWDVDPWFEERAWEAPAAESVEVVEAGPLRASVRVTRRTERSTITQEVRLAAHSRRLDFVTHVDWRERRVLLKCAFPVAVHSPQATYEIQFGAISRPTHKSTGWDRARFEVPAQRWADLSEAGYGVALLNDCKYGYDVQDNVLRLSLLRSPIDPDPEADQGEHDFTYALYPHAGAWQEAGVVRRGLELNVPLLAAPAGKHPGTLPLRQSAVCAAQAQVVVEALKRAEDGDDLVLRVYEAHGGRGPVELAIDLPMASVVECNGMEEEIGPAEWRDGVLRFDVTPWQIRSFRLRLRAR